ncbi:aldehyde dehydrogenase family protein [Ilumatobacter nonamiensis]|uniref:aldehyde dehydrogenase family protein n=1 Tax=Ilumatobacter nonamiensis TaxID=467093 RepID=UPI00034BE726|nr:aldehyde dehydrogenase family protein [Ilumatobacter nonamiensis]
MSRIQRPLALDRLDVGQPIVFGGDRVVHVGDELADNFRPGDHLVVVQETGDLLHVPASEHELVERAVSAAVEGFAGLARCTDDQIDDFFAHFARLLADDTVFAAVAEANAADVESARSRGRTTTRLELTPSMREAMVAGLRGWQEAGSARDAVVDTVVHDGWSLEARRAPLGVVAFVFEGRPNVFADACGVLRSGNSVVFRIGSDALGTARAIVEHALDPALREAGLPAGAVALVDSPSRSAGHALFSDRRLALAVARGSGPAVAQLGAVASQAGIPVSLHGTGGAWIVAGEQADADAVRTAIHHSLDRKVCNTVNCVAMLRSHATTMMPAVLAGLEDAATERGAPQRLHVVQGSEGFVPAELFSKRVRVERAEGASSEPLATMLPESDLAREWEWETSPEMTVVVVDSVDDAIELFDRYSPHFVASLISTDDDEQERFYAAVDAPFVGDGFTRWVDGQYALDKPELGLSNWQGGRMLGRGGILSGDSVHTVRYRARVTDPTTRR